VKGTIGMAQDSTAGSRPSRPKTVLVVALQCLPLLGLGGCTVLWSAVPPVETFLRHSSMLAFWAFQGAAGMLALLSLCWGIGYLYLGQRERLGCATVVFGPLFVLWSYGYLFNGFVLARSDADELIRPRAMLWTALLCAGPVLLMAWDSWRLARAAT
jgi:hypothetical protein